MSLPEIEDLPSIGLLSELNPEIRRRLVARGRFETMDADTHLIEQGTHDDSLSVLVSGELIVSCHAHGDYLELAKLQPGHTIGEMAVLDPQDSSADVRIGDEPARLWTISGEDFRNFLQADKADGFEILMLLSRELCQRLRQNSDHMLNRAEKLRTHFLDMDY